jgi:hypothetical protein
MEASMLVPSAGHGNFTNRVLVIMNCVVYCLLVLFLVKGSLFCFVFAFLGKMLVFEAPPASFAGNVLTIATLFLLFGVALLAPLFILAIIVVSILFPAFVVMFTVLALLFGSVFITRNEWPGIECNSYFSFVF